jgi:hypothetical protein
MGVDGGMNATFLSAVRSHGGPGNTIRTASGTIPAHVNPPAGSLGGDSAGTMSLASSDSRPAQVQVAAASSSGGGIGGFFGNLFGSKRENAGSEGRNAQPAQPPAGKPQPATASPKPAHSTGASVARSKPEAQGAAEVKAPKVAQAKPQPAAAPADAEAKGASAPSLLNGAAPTVPSGGFENRFGAWH